MKYGHMNSPKAILYQGNMLPTFISTREVKIIVIRYELPIAMTF